MLFPQVDYSETLKMMQELGAGVIEQIVRDKNDKALCGVIVLDGDGADEIINAVRKVTDSWENRIASLME